MQHPWIKKWLAAVLLATFALNIAFTVQQPIWAPRDEIAHFDYVVKLTSLRLPRPDEPIADSTFAMCAEFAWARPPAYDGTKAGMGPAGTSYEAWQPPLSYALLVPAYWLLERLSFSPRGQIMTLRLLQLLLVQAGIVLVVLVFAELGRLGVVSELVGYLIAIALSLTNMNHYCSLGNDNLSPLLGAAFAWFHVRRWRLGRWRDLWLAALVAGLGFWCKYTNGLLLPMHLVACCLAPRTGQSQRLIGRLLTGFVPVAMMVGLLLHNQLRFGDALHTGITEQRFAPLVPSIPDVHLFLVLFVRDAFHVDHLGLSTPYSLLWWFTGAVACNLLLLAWAAVRRSWSDRQTVILFACGTAAAVLASAVALNLHKPGAHWFVFRHFFAYSMFWYMACACSAWRLPGRLGSCVILVVGAVLTGACMHYAWTLMSA